MLNFSIIEFDNIIFEHPSRILHIFLTLIAFHFEISGKDDNDEHPLNKQLISVTLIVFLFEISGKDDNDEHPLNRQLISLTF